MKKLILLCAVMGSVALTGCVYRGYGYRDGRDGYYGDRYYSGSYTRDRYDRRDYRDGYYRDRYRDRNDDRD